MSVAANLTLAAAGKIKPSPGRRRFRIRLSAVLRILAAGMRASKDFASLTNGGESPD